MVLRYIKCFKIIRNNINELNKLHEQGMFIGIIIHSEMNGLISTTDGNVHP